MDSFAYVFSSIDYLEKKKQMGQRHCFGHGFYLIYLCSSPMDTARGSVPGIRLLFLAEKIKKGMTDCKLCPSFLDRRKKMNGFFLLLSVIGGAGLAVQAGINGSLGKKIGALEASFLAYAVGTLALLCFTFFFGKGDLSAVLFVSKWKWFIGILGALYIFVMVLSVPKIGTASAIIAAIVGQVMIGMIMDHFGLGGQTISINWFRILGVILMFFALILFYKN